MAGQIVVIGAGEAGARAALALRENGWTGVVTLVGDEPHAPYERPPLSKSVMLAQQETAAPAILTPEQLAAQAITLLSGVPAVAIDRAAHVVALADGRRLAYDRLLIATGAGARRLAVPGASSGRVRYLRKLADSLALRARLKAGSTCIVVGGGFIGLELAASARARGCDVTLVELAPRLLTRAVPAELAESIAARHEAAGVRLLLAARLERIEENGEEAAVVLTDGRRLPAKVVIAGIGAVPDVALAVRAGLAIDNGIAVDGRLCTSDPDIFAAGDCTSFPHPLYGGRRIRLEAWRNAQEQGAHAARALLGAEAHYAAVPWFWSDQYDLTLQVAGLADEGRETVVRRLDDGAQLHFHLATDGRLVAASALGPNAAIARDMRLAEMLIARSARPAREALAAPDVRLKSLLAA